MIKEIIKVAFKSGSDVFVIMDGLEFTGKILEYTATHIKIKTSDLIINDYIGVKQVVSYIHNISSIALLENTKVLNHCLKLKQ